jgi:nuclear transport factor 2 (NTF2) superfamily protein
MTASRRVPSTNGMTVPATVRCYSNELSEFSSDGLMQRREASVPIAAPDRRYFAPRREDMKGVGIPLQ